MQSDWIEQYESKKGYEVHLPGCFSCSKDLKVALSFAYGKRDQDKIPVLFVVTCQNYYEPKGFMMNNEAYSAYPREAEFLLMEGCNVYILDIEHDHKIDNSSFSMLNYNGKTLTIIHMFHHPYDWLIISNNNVIKIKQ